MSEHESESGNRERHEPSRQGRPDEVEIREFGGRTVAYLPDADDAWICGWVDVPR
ncbi:hypothetical protein [Haloarcula nitratireducens]|uniref:Uncharacterized protein n=1 Tax=Haloarcula nitratireducens TaxID=2487749 RepID=A0AAW4P6I2_9EURY|nr:hypothetical protein [Halomicroarcula nitratireducens]MBX0293358.1 hypothetical protein [Halomicroarcula nitratireducens]